VDETIAQPYFGTDFAGGGPQGGGTNPTTAGVLECPILDDSTEPKEQIVTIHVEVMDNNSTSGADFSVTACTQYWNANGGKCGTPATQAGSGHLTLVPDISVWAHTYFTDFGYLYIAFPTNGGNVRNSSELTGIYYTT
jgi:hypothetical protein